MSYKIDNTSISVLYLIDQVWCGRGGSEQHLNWLLERLPDERVKSILLFLQDKLMRMTFFL